MSDFLSFNLNDIPVQGPIDPTKALVVIKKANITTSKKTGRKGLNFMFIIEDRNDASPIWHTLWMPMAGDDPQGNGQIMLGMIRDFYIGMGYDFSAITGTEAMEENIEELTDLQSIATIGFEPANDAQGYAAKNTIKALMQS